MLNLANCEPLVGILILHQRMAQSAKHHHWTQGTGLGLRDWGCSHHLPPVEHEFREEDSPLQELMLS